MCIRMEVARGRTDGRLLCGEHGHHASELLGGGVLLPVTRLPPRVGAAEERGGCSSGGA